MQIKMIAGEVTINAEVYDTPTGVAIAGALPLTAVVNRWGGEIYFTIPVSAPLEADARDVLHPGELGYWPTGKAFCIFFGTTPASQSDECRAASAVNIFGKVSGNLDDLWNVSDGTEVVVEKTTD